jgi:glucose-1-phosphate adenylyltransferase
MQEVLCLILGGGRGARLYPLTKHRSEPAVPIAGKYRLIDIPISNCLNSGLNRIYVLTQFLSVSLHRHLASTYKFDPFSHGFVEVLAAQQTNETAEWYEGTADAVRQNLSYVAQDRASDILVLSGDQLYHIDFRRLLAAHREAQSDLTIAVAPVGPEQAPHLGIVRLDDDQQVTHFVEKPRAETQLAPLRTPAEWWAGHRLPVQGKEYVANMGMYLFRRQALFDLLRAHATATDFATEIFPRCLATHRVRGYLFDGYWEDVGSVASYHRANLALAGPDPPFEFHSPQGVIYTRMRFLPASRVNDADVENCLIGDACVVRPGARLRQCVLGVRSRIGAAANLRDTVLIGADRFETAAERAENQRRRLPDLGVGDATVIERAILDKDCRIGRDVRIIERGRPANAEGPNYVIRDGIVVIPNGAVVPDGAVI